MLDAVVLHRVQLDGRGMVAIQGETIMSIILKEPALAAVEEAVEVLGLLQLATTLEMVVLG
jgi:hypothetical protein